MQRLIRFFLIRLFLLALVACLAAALAAGCGATRQALRPGEPKVEFRLPAGETVDVGLRTEAPPRPPVAAPFSVTDESRGRWLTLFQIDVTPSEAAGVPSAPAESP